VGLLTLEPGVGPELLTGGLDSDDEVAVLALRSQPSLHHDGPDQASLTPAPEDRANPAHRVGGKSGRGRNVHGEIEARLPQAAPGLPRHPERPPRSPQVRDAESADRGSGFRGARDVWSVHPPSVPTSSSRPSERPVTSPVVPAALEEGIRVRGLVKRFGTVVALDGLDLDVAPGEIVSVLGPNGAGKSTLLRILGTSVLPDQGVATVCGRDVVREPGEVRRQVGLMIGDERSFYWRVSGRGNLMFFAALYGMRRREAAARSATLLDIVGLSDVADRPVRGYSSGMRARLSLARALLADPPLLLLDEPTQNLDPLAAAGFREIAGRLARERDTGILFATHDLHEAVAVSDRIVVLAAGRSVLEERAADTDASRLESAFLEAVNEAGGAEPIAIEQ
jgi:ABC-type multidrug transport system ATPase subunit